LEAKPLRKYGNLRKKVVKAENKIWRRRESNSRPENFLPEGLHAYPVIGCPQLGALRQA